MQAVKDHRQHWLKVLQLLKKITDEQKYDEYKVEEIDCGGNNIMSTLFSATLTAPGKGDLKLIAKAMFLIDDKLARDSSWPHTVELYFYTTLIEKFKRVEELHNLPEEHRLIVPKFYGSYDEYPNETLVLEDLTARGFKSFERTKCIELQHAYKVIELIAKFHALSFACYKDDHEGFQNILEQKLENTSEREMTVKMMAPKALANAYEISTDENRKALEKYFNNDERDRFSHFVNTFNKSNKNMRVLVHGDFKTSNLMYRNLDNQLEMAILDFQFVCVRNPVTDLVYYFFVSADEQFRRLFYHQLLDLYYEQLKLALGRLHVDYKEVYSQEAFRKDVEELAMAGLVLGVVWLPLLTADAAAVAALETRTEASDLAAPPSAFYRERLNGIVNNYRQWGLL